MRKKLSIVLMALVFAVILSGCGEHLTDKTERGNGGTRTFELDTTQVVLAEGDVFSLGFSGNNAARVQWKTDNPSVCAVSDNGMLLAKMSGKANIKAEINPKLFAICKVTVTEGIVSADYDSKTVGFGVNRFDSVRGALAKCADIAIMPGEYDEYVVSDGDISMLGVGSVKLRGIGAKSLNATNIAFEADYVQGMAMVTAEESLSLDKCNITFTGKDHSGVMGIALGSSVQKVSVTDCNITGFGEGLNSVMSPADFNIIGNRLTDCGLGIGIDLRNIGGFGNVNAKGMIKNNIFVGCETDTEFLFVGNYDGKLEFFDIKRK